jgi:hypothetical protein
MSAGWDATLAVSDRRRAIDRYIDYFAVSTGI